MGLFGLGLPEVAVIAGVAALIFGASAKAGDLQGRMSASFYGFVY